MWKKSVAVIGLAVLVGACSDGEGTIVGPGGSDLTPLDLRADTTWVHAGWLDSGQPDGAPAVDVSWDLPRDWRGEEFAVYSKRASQSSFGRIATVTSCGQSLERALRDCVYRDRNVAPGESYDYFVATVLSTGQEVDSNGDRAAVPTVVIPATPAAPAAMGLDGAAYLTWEATGAGAYAVLLDDEQGGFFLLGETDGTSFLDDRAENGVRHSYRIAAISADGPRSAQSAASIAIPRPDYHAEVIYAFGDRPAESGFQFVASEADLPIVGGSSGAADWRLEVIDGVPSIVPLGDTRVSTGTPTSALTCGPQSDFDCVSVDAAPAAGELQAGPVAADPGFTYVFSVTDGGQTHFGKIRVLGSTVNAAGETSVVFDWAFQLLPNEPSLHLQAR